MACFRYDPSVPGKWREIRAIEMVKPDRGENLSFKDQVLRGFRRQEARRADIAGKPARIKQLWKTPPPPFRGHAV